MSIRTKLVVAFLLAVIVSMGSVMVLVSRETGTSSLEASKQNTRGQLVRVNEYIEVFFNQIQENARFLASSPQVINSYEHLINYLDFKQPTEIPRDTMNPETRVVDELIGIMRDTHPVYSGIFVGFDNARFIEYPTATWPVGWDPRNRPWFNSTLQGTKDVNISATYSTPQGMAVCAVTSKIFLDRKAVGVLGIDIKLESIVNLVTAVKLGESGYLMLLEKSGMVLADAQKKDLVFKNINDSQVDALKKAFALDQGSMVGEIDGVPRLITVFTGYNGWKLIGIMDEAEVYASSHAMVMGITFMGLGVVVLLIVLSVLLAGSISRPIDSMVRLSRDIADGRIAELPASSAFSGEMGVLYQSLRDMVSKLGELIRTSSVKTLEAEEQANRANIALREVEVAQNACAAAQQEGIVRAAERLESMVMRICDASEDISTAASAVENNSKTQRDRAIQASSAMGQMNEAVREVAAGASLAAESVDTARQQAEDGGKLVLSVEKSIQEVVRFSKQLDGQLNSLGEHAQSISRIMVMISDVADQTNLLALNAAIEAARAGDAGRGFAVVADEVRKLAEKTMAATGEVGKVVESIRFGADASIKDMHTVTGHVDTTRDLAKNAGESLTRIVNMVQESASQVRAIATASEQQSASSTEITRNVEAVTSLAVEISNAMSEASQSVRNLVADTTEIEKVIQRLKEE